MRYIYACALQFSLQDSDGAGEFSHTGCVSWNSVLNWLAAWNELVGPLVESSHGSTHCATAVTGSH